MVLASAQIPLPYLGSEGEYFSRTAKNLTTNICEDAQTLQLSGSYTQKIKTLVVNPDMLIIGFSRSGGAKLKHKSANCLFVDCIYYIYDFLDTRRQSHGHSEDGEKVVSNMLIAPT